MKNSVLFLLLFSVELVFGQVEVTDSSAINLKNKLVSQPFRLWEGIPTQNDWAGNCVAGYSSVDRSIKFFSDSTFEELVWVDERPVFAFTIQNDSVVCEGRDNHDEISLLPGTWQIKNDTIYVLVESELIYTESDFHNCYETSFNKPKFKCDQDPIRICQNNVLKKFIFSENGICEIYSSYGCYR